MTKIQVGKILVIDDTPANRYAATRILKMEGHRLLEAATAATGIELARQEQPDVILLDVNLPDMLGLEATELLKSDPDTAHIPILQISASYTSADARALGLESGADAYLSMPIEPQVLLATVNALLRLHRAERDLQEALRYRDEFLSIASHDLRTPLTSIQLTMELVVRNLSKQVEPAPKEKLLPHLSRVLAQSKLLSQMLESLLDISQVGTGSMTLELEPVELPALVHEVLARYRETIEKSGSPVSLRADVPVVGQWDRMRLEQVVSNLLSNAIKYGNGNAIELEVTASVGGARLSVRDHGVGIPHEQQQRVFQRFERGQRGRSLGSYGLGLWIVQKIVDACGGRISLESAPGKGSTFTVDLPLQGRASDMPDQETELRVISGGPCK